MSADPWAWHWYERRKHASTVALLLREKYRACSNPNADSTIVSDAGHSVRSTAVLGYRSSSGPGDRDTPQRGARDHGRSRRGPSGSPRVRGTLSPNITGPGRDIGTLMARTSACMRERTCGWAGFPWPPGRTSPCSHARVRTGSPCAPAPGWTGERRTGSPTTCERWTTPPGWRDSACSQHDREATTGKRRRQSGFLGLPAARARGQELCMPREWFRIRSCLPGPGGIYSLNGSNHMPHSLFPDRVSRVLCRGRGGTALC